MREAMLAAACLSAAILLPATSYAQAKDWPETAGWTIFEGEDFCGMSSEFEGKGETRLTLGRNLDGSVLLVVGNYGWSARKDAEYKLDFQLGAESYGGAVSRGNEIEGRKGFTTKFGPDFWPVFKAAPSLRIVKGETVVDHLTLSGSSAAGAVIDRCMAHVRGLRAAEERERARLAHIPDDPFAATQDTPAPEGPKLPASASSWITADDYPPAALKEGLQGTVSVRLEVDAGGRVDGCTITGSSGSPLLDASTCSILQRRARLEPAKDAGGAAVRGTVEHKFTWELPGSR